MPRQLFHHICQGRSAFTPHLVCHDCGEPGELGWHLETHELRARYQYVYQLNPDGAHRSLADWLLGDLREPCPRCLWVGLLTVDALFQSPPLASYVIVSGVLVGLILAGAGIIIEAWGKRRQT